MERTMNAKEVSISEQFHWYSLRVISGKERTVEDNINYESKLQKIEEAIEEVFVTSIHS